MKKRQIFIFLILFVLVFSITFASAGLFDNFWNKITGKATFVGPYKVYEGRNKDVKIGSNIYNVEVKSVISSTTAVLNIAGKNYDVVEGKTSVMGNLQIKVIEISNKRGIFNNAYVKFSVAESEGGSSSSEMDRAPEKPAAETASTPVPEKTIKISTFVGPYKVYEGKTKTVKIFENKYNVEVVSISAHGATFKVGSDAKEIFEGQTEQIGNLQIKVISASSGNWLNGANIKFSVAEVQSDDIKIIETSSCTQAGYICGNESNNPLLSCTSKEMDWVGNSTLDFSCEDGDDRYDEFGCCKEKTITSNIINGTCGSAVSNLTLNSKPIINLCFNGISTEVIGTGTTADPWTWICLGINSGTNATCNAYNEIEIAITKIQCEQEGYICGNIDGSGPIVSCKKRGMDYVGDANLDLSCDISGMAGCCKEKNIEIVKDNWCNQLSIEIKNKTLSLQEYLINHKWESGYISYKEGEKTFKNNYLLLPTFGGGVLLRVSTLTNSITGYSSDAVKFLDVFSGDTYSTVITEDGIGTLTVGGRIYNVIYGGTSAVADTSRWVELTWGNGSSFGDVGDEETIFDCEGFVDLIPPRIIKTDLFDIQQTTAKVKIEISRPSICRYSSTNTDYDFMSKFTETSEMQNIQIFTLENLDPLLKHDFYIKCKSEFGIVNNQEYSKVTIYPSGSECADSFNKFYRERDGSKGELIYCENGCKDGECFEESICKELINGYNNIEENRINIIFTGFNFNNIDEVKKIANTYKDQLTSYEPFKSNQDKFNYWYINKLPIINNPSVGFSYFGNEMNSEQFSSYCLVQNKQRIAIGNWKFRSNADFFGNGMRISTIDLRLEFVFPHEFGHSFGGLDDEYSRDDLFLTIRSPKDSANCDDYDSDTGIACPKWCSGVAKSVEEFEKFDCSSASDRNSCDSLGRNCRWIYNCPDDKQCDSWFADTLEQKGCVNQIMLCKEIINKDSCNIANDGYWNGALCEWDDLPNTWWGGLKCIPSDRLNSINIGVDCIEDTGCYNVCGYPNWYKPYYYGSIMSGYGYWEFPPEFKYLHRKQICNRFKKLTGSAGGICTSEFGII